MTHLFSEDENHERVTLLDKLNYCSCLSTHARIDDDFPQFICMSCSVLLESAYQLKLLCAKTEEKLNDLQRRSRQTTNHIESDRTKPIVDETNYELTDDYIIEEVVGKHEEDVENDAIQPSRIE